MNNDDLPKYLPQGVKFNIANNNVLTITMTLDGMTSNMQEDSAAFEGWSVCLYNYLKKEIKIKLTTDAQIEDIKALSEIDNRNPKALHFKRFLYRLQKFSSTFNAWFEIDEKLGKTVSVVENWSDLYLNYPTQEAQKNDVAHKEAKLERAIVSSDKLKCEAIGHQLPVGVFYKEKRDDYRLMPGNNSAIDIWSITQNTFSIYELKAYGNCSVGIISELFFYVNIMNDLFNGRAKYDGRAAKCDYRNFKIVYDFYRSKGIKTVEGCFLAPKYHVLIDNQQKQITDILNEYGFIKYKFLPWPKGLDCEDVEGNSYVETERKKQVKFFEGKSIATGGWFKDDYHEYCVLNPQDNIFSQKIAEDILKYFGNEKISFWSGNTIPNHMLSSQVSCLNHLFPIRKNHDLVLALAKKLLENTIYAGRVKDVLEVNCEKEKYKVEDTGYIAFEVVSSHNLLNEGRPNRGANCTSIDAVILIETTDYKRVLLPIEWKYTEHYNNTDKSIENDPDKFSVPESKGRTRLERYDKLIANSVFLNSRLVGNNDRAPYESPSSYRRTLFFIEPFYQLMRQTLWAEAMINAHGKEWCGKVDDYMHIHVIPAGNNELLNKKYVYSKEKGLKHTWTKECLSNKGKERYMLVNPSNIVDAIEAANKDGKNEELVKYLRTRYNYK
ncbi:MAG: hypothetical protein HUK14_00715 [Muribaculaceae bacterium]|nr:hypothetical protein [Muribaculaceae bacterium]